MFHADPIDRLALSHWSYELLGKCERKWILHYACNHLPHEQKWLAKQQKKLTLWPWFVGSVVDATISECLLYYTGRGEWPTNIHRRAHQIMCEWWQHSLHWTDCVSKRLSWPKGNGYQPIDRHYYEEPIVAEERQSAMRRIFQCLDNFLESPLPASITSFPVEYWRGPRALTEWAPKYQVEHVPVWASYDFAIQSPDLTYIFDWKTGEASHWSCQRAHQQLLWYALYAVREWKVPVEQVRLCPVWLRRTAEWRVWQVTQVELDRLIGEITERYEQLSARLLANDGGRVRLDQWPLTDDLRECVSCPFRGVCEGSKRVPTTESTVAAARRHSHAAMASTAD